jgi:hypothetical protein
MENLWKIPWKTMEDRKTEGTLIWKIWTTETVQGNLNIPASQFLV